MWTAPKGKHMQSPTRAVVAGIATAALLIGAAGCAKTDPATTVDVPSAAPQTDAAEPATTAGVGG